MTVRLIGQANPQHLPEHVLWTLHKSGRTAEARTRMVPIGEGLPELRIYVSRSSDPATLDLLWSQVMKDGRIPTAVRFRQSQATRTSSSDARCGEVKLAKSQRAVQ